MFNDATKKWYRVPKDIREQLKQNVFCSNCGVTTIIDFKIESSGASIILKGKCIQCNSDVARVIESEN
jgi:ribosomal protein S27AE